MARKPGQQRPPAAANQGTPQSPREQPQRANQPPNRQGEAPNPQQTRDANQGARPAAPQQQPGQQPQRGQAMESPIAPSAGMSTGGEAHEGPRPIPNGGGEMPGGEMPAAGGPPLDNGGYSLIQEAGASGLKQYSGYVREEWLATLIGRKGMLVYREMRDNDPIIGAIFFAIEMLIRGVAFHVEGGDSSPRNQAAADFVESCLTDMEQSWASFLAEIMPFLLYGWDVHEIVYKVRQGYNPKDLSKNSKYDDGMIGWRKFAGRAQETLLHWVFDDAGDASAMVQLLPTGGPLLTVPLSRCLHFRTTSYKSNPEGRSIIRNAYTSYYFKKRIQEIEAIGVERDLTGLPVMYVPARWTLQTAQAADKQAFEIAKKVVRDVRRNQQEGVVLPMIFGDAATNYQQELKLELLATGGRRQFATTEIIQRYNENIAGCVLADFITLGGSGTGGKGSYAMSTNKTDIFSLAMTAILDLIVGEINRKAIPDLLRLNNMADCEVTLQHGDISRRDLDQLGNYLTSIASAGILTPDATLEAHVREEGGLPPADQTSMRDPTGGGDTGQDPNAPPGAQNQPGKPGQPPGKGKPGAPSEEDEDDMDDEDEAAMEAARRGGSTPTNMPPGRHPSAGPAPYQGPGQPVRGGRKVMRKRMLPLS